MNKIWNANKKVKKSDTKSGIMLDQLVYCETRLLDYSNMDLFNQSSVGKLARKTQKHRIPT